MQADYNMLHDLGIAVAREGIVWPMVDRHGVYEFSSLDPVDLHDVMEAAQPLDPKPDANWH